MSDSLRDQLLGLGFKPTPQVKPARQERPERDKRREAQTARDGKPASAASVAAKKHDRRSSSKPMRHDNKPSQGRPDAGIDLAKAYAIRAQREKDERIEAERQKQEQARLRREARAKLAEWAKDKALNLPDADIARHFPYGGKIKRIYVTAEQLKSLNSGELGVIQIEGRYLLVTAQAVVEAEEIFAPAVALKVDPTAPAEDDPYADPKYQVPDDLIW